MAHEDAEAFAFPQGLDAVRRSDDRRSGRMSGLTVFDACHNADRDLAIRGLQSGLIDDEEDRVFGALLGLAVGDALGAPLEFSDLSYGASELTGFKSDFWCRPSYNRFALRPGQWTDDTSMALCLADSLLLRDAFDAHDLRLRFLNWWYFGYCNAFFLDDQRPTKTSVGLGGNIWQSFEEFTRLRTQFTTAGDLKTSGNGSLMRNAPVALFFRHDDKLATAMSYWQSKTTHQGEEAAECCRLLTRCILDGIRGDGTARCLEGLADRFTSQVYSVDCLSRSDQEDACSDNMGANLEDRNWNWLSSEFRYSPARAREHPEYIGSYAMDALAMALHCVWSTSSFSDAVLKCANLGGDADTTAAITGQIAGAIYGASAIPTDWIETILRWDAHSDILLRAHKLSRRQRIAVQ
ncbi:ADP-ribosylglycohydrolase family protein [Novosphingobium pentaromativorans]|nr:ADP-ribosylglycohydrolase family protein [Novosphingobium pentaromativorans]